MESSRKDSHYGFVSDGFDELQQLLLTEECLKEEPLNLDPFASEVLDRQHRNIISC